MRFLLLGGTGQVGEEFRALALPKGVEVIVRYWLKSSAWLPRAAAPSRSLTSRIEAGEMETRRI